MRRLVILSGSAKGQAVELTQGTLSIGRADENNLVLEDSSVSRRHAVLTVDGAEYRLRDVGSRNGTRVNGRPVQETKLVPGDAVQFGEVEARYEAGGPAVSRPVVAAPGEGVAGAVGAVDGAESGACDEVGRGGAECG